MATVATIFGLLVVITILTLLADKIGLPYPALMVIAGVGISLIPWWPEIRVPPEYFFLVFIPPLVYAAAWDMPWRDFRMNLRPILLLAIGFVLFTTGVVAAVAHELMAGITWAAAVAFGGIVAPTDPVAASAIISGARGPQRVTTVLEGESLVNDASGLTIYHIAVLAVVIGGMTVGEAAKQATIMIAAGIGIGLIVGWITAWIHRRMDNTLVETVITLLTPYAAFLPAYAVNASGVLAVVTTGLYVSHRSPHIFSPLLRLRGRTVWNVVSFLMNALVFILVGLEMRGILQQIEGLSMGNLVWHAVVFFGLVTVARAVWVFAAAAIPRWISHELRERDPMPPWKHMVVLAFTSMRGVVSLAAALSLPVATLRHEPFPARSIIIFQTFAIILGTLVLQSILLRPLMWMLGLTGEGENRCTEWDARRQAIQAGLDRLDELERDHKAPPEQIALLRRLYQERLNSAGGDGNQCDPREREHEKLLHELIEVERERLLQLYDNETINETMLRRIEMELDMAQLRLEGGFE